MSLPVKSKTTAYLLLLIAGLLGWLCGFQLFLFVQTQAQQKIQQILKIDGTATVPPPDVEGGSSTAALATATAMMQMHMHMQNQSVNNQLQPVEVIGIPLSKERYDEYVAKVSESEMDEIHAKVLQYMERHHQVTGKTLVKGEGHLGQRHLEMTHFMTLVKLWQSPVVCEIGFAGGVSSLVMYWTNPALKYYGFDIGSDRFYGSKQSYQLIESEYLTPEKRAKRDDEFKVYWGKSEDTLKPANIERQCNVLIIDGGHMLQFVEADFINGAKVVNQSSHIAVMDDCFPTSSGDNVPRYGKFVTQVYQQAVNGHYANQPQNNHHNIHIQSVGNYQERDTMQRQIGWCIFQYLPSP